MEKIIPPWDEVTVAALNNYQQKGYFHPFTCEYHGNQAHKKQHKLSSDPVPGLLYATTLGWRCPACDYTQSWAHKFMADHQPLPDVIINVLNSPDYTPPVKNHNVPNPSK